MTLFEEQWINNRTFCVQQRRVKSDIRNSLFTLFLFRNYSSCWKANMTKSRCGFSLRFQTRVVWRTHLCKWDLALGLEHICISFLCSITFSAWDFKKRKKKCGNFSDSGLNLAKKKKSQTKFPQKAFKVWLFWRVYLWCDPFIVCRDRFVQVSPFCFLFSPRGVMA